MSLYDLVFHRCWCSIEHAIPASLDRQARENKRKIFCPLGHEWIIGGDSPLEKERRARQQAEQRLAEAQDEKIAAINAQHKAERALKRHSKRAAAGVCPCCTRTFVNMGRHMKTKHPDFGGTNVAKLKAVAA